MLQKSRLFAHVSAHNMLKKVSNRQFKISLEDRREPLYPKSPLVHHTHHTQDRNLAVKILSDTGCFDMRVRIVDSVMGKATEGHKLLYVVHISARCYRIPFWH